MSECIEWWGTKDDKGYGIAYVRGRTVKAHRLVWEECFGPIPEDRPLILHGCDNPPCVNPEHLRPGTHQDNMDDKNKRGRGVYPGAPVQETCTHGHPLSGDNLAIRSRGKRGGTQRCCRACDRAKSKRHYDANKIEVRKIR